MTSRPVGPARYGRSVLASLLLAVLALVGVAGSARAGGVEGDDDADGYVASGSVLLGDSFEGSDTERARAVDCPGCRWELRSVCRPGEIVGDETCAAASAGCPVATTRMRLQVWAPAQPWWRAVGTICVGPGTGMVSVVDVATAVRERVEEYLPSLRPGLQPSGRTLAGLPTVLMSGQPGSVGPVALDVLGHEVRLVATPRWRWVLGDGTDLVTAQPGQPWPAAPLTHTFRRTARLHVAVTTRWTARFTVDGFGPFDVPPPEVTQTATLPLTVAEGRARLVR